MRQDTNGTPTGKRQDSDRRGVDVTTAARMLGISPDAVRGRLHRGTLEGKRGTGGHWTIFLEQPPAPEPTDRPATGHRQDADRALYQAMIDRQDAEIAFLRDQLDHSRRELSAERERFDTIHQMALLRIEALMPGDVESDDTAQNPRTAPTVAPGREEPPESTSSTFDEPSIVAGWLRRLFGRS